ncbi:hypothetical protein KJ570_00760 [Patescibacteria group bacterium]|nr:hypothetical protein [Patescibacteria group bacterium]MBU2035941.1 hypothetical protein [Patescibacteria group bacterium]
MAGIETGCSVEGCKFLQDGKCSIIEHVRNLAENGIYTEKDWETIQYVYGVIVKEDCTNVSEFKEELKDIIPNEFVKEKEKIV